MRREIACNPQNRFHILLKLATINKSQLDTLKDKDWYHSGKEIFDSLLQCERIVVQNV